MRNTLITILAYVIAIPVALGIRLRECWGKNYPLFLSYLKDLSENKEEE